MPKQRKCKKCGQYGHQARTCGRAPKGNHSQKRQAAKDWKMQALASIAGTLESSQPEPSTSEEASHTATEESDLPPVSVPPLSPQEESATESTSTETTQEAASDSSGPNASASDAKKADDTSHGPAGESSRKKYEPPGKEKIVEMGANMWCASLAIAGEYAKSKGFMAVPDALIAVNHMAVEIVLNEWLKDSTVLPAEVAAFVCLGTGGFAGANAYFAWRSTVKKGPSAPNKGNVIDAQFTVVDGKEQSPGPNGATQRPREEYAPDGRVEKPITRGEYT